METGLIYKGIFKSVLTLSSLINESTWRSLSAFTLSQWRTYTFTTNFESAPFRAYHGFVRKDDSIRPVIQFPAFLFPFETMAFAFSRILYPLSHRLILRSSYCIYR